MQSSAASARSPCGSSSASPSPAARSWRDQIEEKRALAGAGLADDVEVPAPFLRVEHDIIAQRMGADAEAVGLVYSWAERSRCAVRIAIGNMVRAAPSFP